MIVTPLPPSFSKAGMCPACFGQFSQKKRGGEEPPHVYREFGILSQ